MNARLNEFAGPKLVKVPAAVLIGLSIGAILPPDPVAIETVGLLPGIGLAGAGISIGAIAYFRGPELMGAKSCGCTGDCGCSK